MPPIPNHIPQASPYWPYYTEQERRNILDHPIEDATIEITLIRSLIAGFLCTTSTRPITDPDLSLQSLYAVSVASSTIANLIKYQREYQHTHPKYEKELEAAYHRARIKLGIYRQMYEAGFAVPDDLPPGTLDPLPPDPPYIPPTTITP
ncbi:MAG: hypothetical protein A2X25_09020 [Chloroflexi bacterium GWB2_49_20]|nr:MAG: hypothetical protein A2X25_09020 [Chloroflexi bacterium GWB2_49_20]OGN79426.1 MAG: hypothetical protein A2X26_05005 [Chloroflexi bacterium GWC2_49_37]OGN82805.1 MAG: hypothetical protein A2X27_07690 [Chloroflexi bacterium GWD2_49_16]HCC79705.1 hypothetical protein [Anaerolineae bacterium]HCM97277.1 hypothetical protein [Anaerolineae bacterium]